MSQSNFEVRIRRLRETGVDPVIATPIPLAELWERARSDPAFTPGRLIAVRTPLWWRAGAAHDPDSGDAWLCWHPDAPERSLRNLLHELAHNRRKTQLPATVADDWRDELETWLEAAAIAAAWGLNLFPAEILDELCSLTEQLGVEHQAAAELAGTTDPRLARAAHIALCDLAEARGWDGATFVDALDGVHRDAAVNDAAVGFDRTALRSAWSIGHGVGGSFGAFGLADAHASSWLRDGLRRMARGEGQRPFAELRLARYEPKLLWFGELASDDTLPAVLGACQTALLAHEGRALAFWTLYADRSDAAQILNLRVSYEAQPGGKAPLPAEVWLALHPHRKARGRVAAAALQRYAESWLAMTRLCVEPLIEGYAHGVSALWSRLGAR